MTIAIGTARVRAVYSHWGDCRDMTMMYQENCHAPKSKSTKWRKGIEMREETTGQFYKRYRNLCQKRLGEDKAKGRCKK